MYLKSEVLVRLPTPNAHRNGESLYYSPINRRIAMTYTCQNCGITADNSSSLCNPASEELGKFCGAPADQVCEEQLTAMNYVCSGCGSMSAEAEHLCDPELIRH